MLVTDIRRAARRVDIEFRCRFGKNLSDLEITNIPGWWRDKNLSRHPGFPVDYRASYRYLDPVRRPNGSFRGMFRTWQILWWAEVEKG